MKYPARGPTLFVGIDGKLNAARRRHRMGSTSYDRNEAPLVRHPARGPAMAGIDGQAHAASRLPGVLRNVAEVLEAARVSGSATDNLSGAKGLVIERLKSFVRPMPSSWLPILVLATLLSGCPAVTEQNARNERWYDSVVEPLQSDNDRALRFYDHIIHLKGADLGRELATAKREFEKEKSGLNRIQLAMLLSLPGAQFRDDHAAAGLLQPFFKDKNLEGSTLRPLALILNGQLIETRKLEDAIVLQAAKTKEEQRKSEVLQQKLEALLEMEMKMLEREQTIPTKKK